MSLRGLTIELLWKECMSVHIQLVDMNVWDAIVNRRFEPQVDVDGVMQNKPKADWSNDDKKTVQHDLRARNILISALGVNKYQSFPHCKTAKVLWDVLECLHEGTKSVKQ